MRVAGVSQQYKISWARLVSDVLSPPVVWTVMAFPLALYGAQSQSSAMITAFIYGFVVCWLPVIYIAWMVKRGKITDIHMKLRKQRILPLTVSVACSGSAVAALWSVKVFGALFLFGMATLVGLFVMGIVTLFWQISLHTMSITSAVCVTAIVFGLAAALWVFPLIPLVAAARLNLKRHTPAQLLAGAFVGIAIPYLIFIL